MQTTTQALIFVFLIYWAVVYLLKKRGVLAKYNISTFGPVVMIETAKGLQYIDKIAAPKRFWRLFANIGIVLMFAGMIFMFSLVVFSDIALIQTILKGVVIEPSEYNELQNIFLIPGINQFIPLVWGIVALIIAIFVHEMMHSVLARAEDIRLHAVGLVFALFPIGAYAKIDDRQLYGDELDNMGEQKEGATDGYNDLTASIEEIREHEQAERDASKKNEAGYEVDGHESVGTVAAETKGAESSKTSGSVEPKVATKNQRSRILAAGVMANFCVALIAAMIFFGPVLGGIQPVGNLQIMGMDDISPSLNSGLMNEMVLTSINGQKITDAESVNQALLTASSGDPIHVRASYNRTVQEYTVIPDPSAENVNYAGILIARVVAGSPAEAAGIQNGMIIYKIDGEYINGMQDFADRMGLKSPGETAVFTIKELDDTTGVSREIEVILGETPGNETKAYIGINYSAGPLYIGLLGITVGEFNAEGYLTFLRSLPSLMVGFDLSDMKGSLLTMLSAWLFILMMPFFGLTGDGFSGFSGAMLSFFEPAGWAEPFGVGIFWAANLLFWVAWLNFYVGLFNCLPAIPLDGGHLFRTYFLKIAEKFKMEEKKAVRLSVRVSGYLTVFIFMSFVIMFVWPHLSGFILGLFG
ncbi:MAG: site-2 protease family protein [Methanimicrococcus sp.]|nr:site-2 protease family protein [Methanimicrococcus sp.]